MYVEGHRISIRRNAEKNTPIAPFQQVENLIQGNSCEALTPHLHEAQDDPALNSNFEAVVYYLTTIVNRYHAREGRDKDPPLSEERSVSDLIRHCVSERRDKLIDSSDKEDDSSDEKRPRKNNNA
jgi:hypothetical protein